MEFREHVHITGNALKNWLVATSYDALAVGCMWLAGLLIIGVPWAPVWAVLAGLLQFIPHFGPILGLIMPAVVGAISGGWERLLYVLILYAVIVVIEGLVLQPMLMKRRARVPIWASILAPFVLGFFFSFWGVLVAAPLLAIIFAYRARLKNGHGLHGFHGS